MKKEWLIKLKGNWQWRSLIRLTNIVCEFAMDKYSGVKTKESS
jgi:hypothetical protein